MKKIIASAVGLMLVGGVAVTNAAAVESQFGGYWRTRMFFQDNFTQPDSSFNRNDTRTRLYYTAKFNENLKFVNRFEFNTSWGDANGGDIGADGDTFVVKNSYVDFNLGMLNAKIGMQGGTVSRGFIFADDFAGVTLTGDFGNVKVPVVYMSVAAEDVRPATTEAVEATDAGGVLPVDDNGNPLAVIETTPAYAGDYHIVSVMPTIKISDAVQLTPHATWATITEQDTDIYWIGADVDLKFDPVSAWATFIYNGGELENAAGTNSDDISAFLVGAGADAGIVHGQAFYATGDDDAVDTDHDEFQSAPGASYYWSEIMGYGIFDNAKSTNAPADKISNVAAFNLGVTVKPMAKLTLDFDVWYAMLAEDKNMGTVAAPRMENDLGLELDGKLTYALLDDLNAEVVFAYLFAGDATGPEDVMEGGVRLSLKF